MARDHAKKLESQRAWRARNPLRCAANRRAWAEAHPEEWKAMCAKKARAYRERNVDKVRANLRAVRNQKQDRLNALKVGPCMDCGNTFPPECMDFDHVRGEKVLGGVSNLLARSPKLVLAEIAKCELVCANCHRIRTKARRNARTSTTASN